jgi:uncharacterized membrane protein
MQEVLILFFAVLVYPVIIFTVAAVLFHQIRKLGQKQDESTKQLASQLHSIQNAIALQQKLRDRTPAPGSIPTPPVPPSWAPVAPSESSSSRPAAHTPADVTPEQAATAVPRPPRNVADQPVSSPFVKRPQQPEGVSSDQAAAKVSHLAAARQWQPPAPRVPNRFEAAAKDVLHKIWNWIIVGEENIPEGVSVEFAIASQWLLRIGIVLLVVGIGFFLKYSIEHGLLTETARVMLSLATGLVLLIAGVRILGGKFHIMGQGLLGGGIATLYFSAFAAANFYHLITVPVAFAAMIAVTALSGFLAIRFHSKLTAILGVVGGYGTPVMLSTGVVNFPGLYGYMLVLGLGVLGIGAWKRWPLLDYLSFIGNFALVFASLKDYDSAVHFWQVMPFLVAFFVLFSTMVFIFNLFNRTKSNLLDVLVLFLNAGVFFSLSYWLIEKSYGEKWVAAVTLGLTAFYVAHVWYCLVRRVLDRELMLSFTALSAFFLAITVPLLLSREWITVSWAVQALVMLWVAGKLNSEFLRNVAYLLYLIVLGRFMLLDLPSQYGKASLADLPVGEYLRQLVERLVMFGVPIGSLAVGYRMLTKPGAQVGLALDSARDIPRWIEERLAAKTAIFVVFGMLFLYMHLELNRTLGALFPPLRLPVLTLLWLSVCLLLLLEFTRSANRIVLGFLGVFVFAVLMKMLLFDLQDWSATSRFYYDGVYTFRDAGFRLLDFGAIIVFFAFATRLLMSQAKADPVIARQAGVAMGIAGVGMLFLYSTLELNSFLKQYVENLRSGGISILWTLFALAFLLRGIGQNIKAMRYVGLALFGIVTWKVFFVDLARLDQLYRIVAFIALGVLVLCGSFLYLRSRSAFSTETHRPPDPGMTADQDTSEENASEPDETNENPTEDDNSASKTEGQSE